jgi:phosphoribosylaminoimidazole-succinocarboxamide synthase
MVRALLTATIPDGQLVSRGKVRDVFATDEALILVATDRISAFDCVLSPGIPGRGVILTQLSNFWFQMFADRVPNHLLATTLGELPPPFCHHPELAGRSTLVSRLEPIMVECVARGYLAGSGLKEYRDNGRVCGIKLPPGLVESDQLPEPIFTPATKATSGHDENISFDRMVEIVGGEIAERLRELTLGLYQEAAAYALQRGIIIADTKLEFGLASGAEQNATPARRITWIDEAFTPDSSRFWQADSYQPGQPQPSFDKQFVRDWLIDSGWDKEPPAPELPAEVVQGTLVRYREAYRRLTGNEIDLESDHDPASTSEEQ